MHYRRLGATGLPVSALALGTWATFGARIGRGEARELVAMAYDAGVNLFDAAETYANGEAERVLGDVLADLRLPRDAWCVTSKAYFGAVDAPRPTQRGLSRKHLRDACDAALKRLRVDYLDLYFCHRPDPEAPLEETIAAMDQLVRAGKVLYWGTSEWPATMIDAACELAARAGLALPVVEQPQYSVLNRAGVEGELADVVATRGIGLTVWSPLASGLLSGKYDAGVPDDARLASHDYAWLQPLVMGEGGERLARARRANAVARAAGLDPAAAAIAWCLRRPQVSSVLLGARTSAQLAANLAALEVLARADAGFWTDYAAAAA
jgi:voltage-dependent potassium channel beta subunit